MTERHLLPRRGRIVGWFSVATSSLLGVGGAIVGDPRWSFAWGAVAVLHLWALLAPDKESR